MNKIKSTKGITLIALVITIVVLLILAGVTLNIVLGNNGIISQSKIAAEKYDYEKAKEKLTLALGDYKIGIVSDDDANLQKCLDKIDAELTDTTDTEYIIEVDGYEFIVDKETLKIISGSKSGGIKPVVEVSIYKQDGTAIIDGEKYETLALTVKISNKSELTSIDEIILQDEIGNVLPSNEEIIGDLTADKTFIINKNSKYIVLAKGTKDGIQKTGKKAIKINLFTNIIYTVSYTNGTDNMNFVSTYNKTTENATSEEQNKLNEIKANDSSTTYKRAIKNSNGTITAIGEETRTSDDEQIYLYGKYSVAHNQEYYVEKESSKYEECILKQFKDAGFWSPYLYPSYSTSRSTGDVTLNGNQYTTSVPSSAYCEGDINSSTGYIDTSLTNKCTDGSFYYVESLTLVSSDTTTGVDKYKAKAYKMIVKSRDKKIKGDFIENLYGTENEYPNNNYSGSYWYVRNSLMKKYKLYKYDEELNLKSIYDVENREIKTVQIDISNKEDNKVMLKVNATGTDYKTYISEDNSNWQEIENLESGTQKEIGVSDWNSLYIKIEVNSSKINEIEVEYIQ